MSIGLRTGVAATKRTTGLLGRVISTPSASGGVVDEFAQAGFRIDECDIDHDRTSDYRVGH
jgi:hypothetical protein